MDQAPQGVTQTINRVVEKTIERVVTATSTPQAAAVVTKETVVVKSDDATIDAIAKNTGGVIRVKEVTGNDDTKRESFASVGLIASIEGLAVADISVAYRKTDADGAPIPESYIGVYPDGAVFPLNIIYSNQDAGLLLFEPLIQDREKGTHKYVVPKFNTGVLRLGQSVIALGGADTNTVSTGIISSLAERTVQKTPEDSEKVLSAIRTDIRSSDLVSGSVLLNLSGDVIGMSAGSVSVGRNIFIPAEKLLAFVAQSAPRSVAQ
jgi:S1-C subfamily serine protease